MARGPWQRSGTTVAGSSTPGSGTSQLYDPHGIFVDKNKNIYIVDNLRVQKWAPGAATGVTVAGGTLKGMGLDRFYAPVDVVVDNLGNVYVTDYLSNSVRKWAPGATTGTIVAGGNGAGAQLNQFNGPQGIAMDKLGNLYIADRWNDRVMKWAPGASSGILVAGGQGRGAGASQLREPYGVGLDDAGNVYVSDPYNYRVQKWSPGATTGVTVAGGNGNGNKANQLSFPVAIRVSATGDIYIADSGRIIKYAPGATYGVVMAGGFGSPANASEKNKIGTAWGVAVDADENVYVSELTYARVLRFLKKNTSDTELPFAASGNYKVLATYGTRTLSSATFSVRSKPAVPVIKGVSSAEVNTVVSYSIAEPVAGVTYNWTVSSDVSILSGQGSPAISVKLGTAYARISVVASNSCGASAPRNKNVSTITGYAVIGGNNCEGSTLYGGVSVSKAEQYLWFKDSVMVSATGMGESIGAIIFGSKGPGSAADQLNQPEGIFLKGSKMYIVDGTNYRVQRWSVGAASAVTVAGGKGKGTALNQFASPKDVVVDDALNVYVSDALAHRVVKWAPNATTGVVIAGGKGAGNAANQLNGPQSLFIDSYGNLFIADRWNHRVQKWAPGAIQGVTVAGGNGSGSGANQLSEPTGVSVDAAGNVYVSDLNNYRVQKWSPGSSVGVTVAGGKGMGKAPNQLSAPWKVSVDTTGVVYVLDGTRVQKWLVGASYGVTVANGNGVGADGIVANPSGTSFGLFVDSKANIYISDLFEARIRKVKTNVPATAELAKATAGRYYLKAITIDNRTFDSAPFDVIGIPPRPVGISSPSIVKKGATVTFSVREPSPTAQYNWTVPADVEILSGWTKSSITVKWGNTNGQVSVFGSNACGSSLVRIKNISVVEDNLATRQLTAPTVSIYPNPTTDVASVLFDAVAGTSYEITVTNIMGKPLLVKKGNTIMGQNKVDLSVSNLNNDIYIINVVYDGKVSVLKLSKQTL